MRRRRRALLALLALGGSGLAAVTAAPAATAEVREHCGRSDRLAVPGAELQVVTCLDDITTAGLVPAGKTDPADYAGLLAGATRLPSGVPGLQVDGYFPDTSTSNTNNGWAHDSQFVIRLPDRWNGGLVVTGAPGVREQYANDQAISDTVVARGYAFASTDKGNTGIAFYDDGSAPGGSVLEWHQRVTELARAAKQVVRQRYRAEPERTYMTGLSNGGYLTRWQLENRPELYDGGVDWEGTLFRAAGPNLFTYLPTALRQYPRYVNGTPAEREAARQAMIDAGFAPGSEFLWQFHYDVYWGLTQDIYAKEFDPAYTGEPRAYRYFQRPDAVRDAVRRIQLTGRLGKPMLTLHGTLDSLLPPELHADPYRALVREAGAGALHRYYRIEDGNHVDGLYDAFPTRLRPIYPCYRSAFLALEDWVERGQQPPASGLVRNTGGDVVNRCRLET